jgi:hypothetical protein
MEIIRAMNVKRRRWFHLDDRFLTQPSDEDSFGTLADRCTGALASNVHANKGGEPDRRQ